MKRTTKIIALSLVAATLLSGAVSFGANLAKQISVYYRDIKLNINGKEYTPTNEQGEAVEPFIYEGTTYLPLRAVASALGKQVGWDDKTSTVFLYDEQPEIQENDPKLAWENELYTSIDKRLSAIIPKGELDKEILLNISGVPTTAATVRYAVLACTASYGNAQDEETKMQMAEEIDSYFRVNAAVIKLANELGVDLTDEEFAEKVSDVYNEMDSMYGDSFHQIIEAYTYQSVYCYFFNTYLNALYSKIYDIYSQDEEFIQKAKDFALSEMINGDEPYVRAKHVLITFNEDANEEEKAAVLKKANEIYAMALAGENFDMLIEQYGEDPGMKSYPGGYYFTKGEMVEPFEKAAFELEEGNFSKPVETAYGYHVIQRLALDDTDAIKNSEQFTRKMSELINVFLNDNGKEYEIYYSSGYNGRYSDFEKEISDILG